MPHPARYSHVVGIDDFPFDRARPGDVPVVGAVFAGLRLEGILRGTVRRDGANATRRLAALLGGSKFAPQLQLVLLQGIALAGFNVVDIHALHRALGIPVLVVARRAPRMDRIRDALLGPVPGGRRKWAVLQRLGPMDVLPDGLHVQRAGITLDDAARVCARLAVHGRIPEPLRVAHLVAGGVATGQSRGRA